MAGYPLFWDPFGRQSITVAVYGKTAHFMAGIQMRRGEGGAGFPVFPHRDASTDLS